MMGSTVTRKRGTKEYLYYVWYDNRHDKSKRIEKYCGPVNGKNTIKNLTQYKKEELTVQSEGFKAKLQELERLSLKQ